MPLQLVLNIIKALIKAINLSKTSISAEDIPFFKRARVKVKYNCVLKNFIYQNFGKLPEKHPRQSPLLIKQDCKFTEMDSITEVSPWKFSHSLWKFRKAFLLLKTYTALSTLSSGIYLLRSNTKSFCLFYITLNHNFNVGQVESVPVVYR